MLITADEIAANTITANQIAANTITGNQISAGSISATALDVDQLSAISADMGDITAGTISLATGGYVRSGQTAFDTGEGFYLGNDAGTPKFSIGNPAGNNLKWDGADLSVNGIVVTATGSAVQPEHIDTPNLSAISADIGEVTAGTITGATIRTSAGLTATGGIELTQDNGFRVFDDAGKVRMRIPQDGTAKIMFFDASENFVGDIK